jgi:predicted 3-demethylubiquinone-9 3-methyltransferase (glyoxalase superfamily)
LIRESARPQAEGGDAGPGSKGSMMAATFELEGQSFIALNGGPMFNLDY